MPGYTYRNPIISNSLFFGGVTLEIWNQNQYVIKQKVLAIGRKYYIYDSQGKLIGFVKQKIFKLKEDIRIFSDETMLHELLKIKQKNILDWSGTFKVKDPIGARLGFVGRKSWKSILRDTWKVWDRDKRELATLKERGGTLSILRRFIGILRIIPKKYDFISSQGAKFAEAIQKFKIIGDTWIVNISPKSAVDKRLLVTAALMMDIIEQGKGG